MRLPLRYKDTVIDVDGYIEICNENFFHMPGDRALDIRGSDLLFSYSDWREVIWTEMESFPHQKHARSIISHHCKPLPPESERIIQMNDLIAVTDAGKIYQVDDCQFLLENTAGYTAIFERIYDTNEHLKRAFAVDASGRVVLAAQSSECTAARCASYPEIAVDEQWLSSWSDIRKIRVRYPDSKDSMIIGITGDDHIRLLKPGSYAAHAVYCVLKKLEVENACVSDVFFENASSLGYSVVIAVPADDGLRYKRYKGDITKDFTALEEMEHYEPEKRYSLVPAVSQDVSFEGWNVISHLSTNILGWKPDGSIQQVDLQSASVIQRNVGIAIRTAWMMDQQMLFTAADGTLHGYDSRLKPGDEIFSIASLQNISASWISYDTKERQYFYLFLDESGVLYRTRPNLRRIESSVSVHENVKSVYTGENFYAVLTRDSQCFFVTQRKASFPTEPIQNVQSLVHYRDGFIFVLKDGTVQQWKAISKKDQKKLALITDAVSASYEEEKFTVHHQDGHASVFAALVQRL